ncbi:MAG: hypothetical protein ACRDK8_10420 [Solirubrobacteraceae bacterium]
MAQPTSDDRGQDVSTAELPIACTLEATEGAERLSRWTALFERFAPEITREPGQIVARMPRAPGVAAELDALVASERICCSFVEWHVVDGEHWHELRIRGTGEALDAISVMFDSH